MFVPRFKVTACDLEWTSAVGCWSFKITDCDLERRASSGVSWNMKSSGNLSMLRLTAWISARVSTSYKWAKSASRITLCPRRTRIACSICSAGTRIFSTIRSRIRCMRKSIAAHGITRGGGCAQVRTGKGATEMSESSHLSEGRMGRNAAKADSSYAGPHPTHRHTNC